MSSLSDISIRTELRPGDIGTITALHGEIYASEYNWGVGFEAYVAEGLAELFEHCKEDRSTVWIAEDELGLVGCIALVDRGEAAQLRYYLVVPEYRGIGLGKKLMDLFMSYCQEHGYRSAYLWTTSDLDAAAGLYSKYGFQLVEKKTSTAFGTAVEEQRYELSLK